jgi:hypothetical protein
MIKLLMTTSKSNDQKYDTMLNRIINAGAQTVAYQQRLTSTASTSSTTTTTTTTTTDSNTKNNRILKINRYNHWRHKKRKKNCIPPLPLTPPLLLHLLLIQATLVQGSCPNSCSGHGVCRLHSQCTCYPEWQAFDCSERACPSHISWNDSPYGQNKAHFYEECSGRGQCNHKTGECNCYPGFSGDACRRLSCPNDCSGHGQCLTTEQHGKLNVHKDFFSDKGVKLNKNIISGRFTYKKWDQYKTASCLCDPGFTGIHCNDRKCPRGDDPLTTEDEHGRLEVYDIQTITVGPGTGTIRDEGTASGYFTLTFTDSNNEKWTTRPIQASDKTDDTYCHFGATLSGNIVTANAVRDALMNLPNDVVNKVRVSLDTSSSAGVGLLKYRVTFIGSTVSGKQHLLECNHVGCNLDGCAPRFNGIEPAATAVCTVKGATSYEHETVTVASSSIDGQDGTAENQVCSRRGLCDRKTGRCQCFDGYQGAACSIQTVLI